ncbi:MAG: helix-turn-helix transcriptional regulator [Betaproteobacteria bacterium]
MRKKEEKFVSEKAKIKAEAWGARINTVRLLKNMTQQSAAERARMSKFTWLKIEKGDPSVSMGAWLSAMDILGLLSEVTLSVPDTYETATANPLKKRVRTSKVKIQRFDF